MFIDVPLKLWPTLCKVCLRFLDMSKISINQPPLSQESHVMCHLFPWDMGVYGGSHADPMSPWHRAAQHGQISSELEKVQAFQREA